VAKKKIEISYDDYKHGLITTGDAMRMDLAHNWNRDIFDAKLDKQIYEDKSLTGNQIHSIMMVANSYLRSSLFIRLMQHPNFDRGTINYFMKNLNSTPIVLQQFYINLLRYDLWTESNQIKRAIMQQDYSIDGYYFSNERAIKEIPEIITDLMYRYQEGNPQWRMDIAEKIINVAINNSMVMDLVMSYFDETGKGTYLPDTARELFLF